MMCLEWRCCYIPEEHVLNILRNFILAILRRGTERVNSCRLCNM